MTTFPLLVQAAGRLVVCAAIYGLAWLSGVGLGVLPS